MDINDEITEEYITKMINVVLYSIEEYRNGDTEYYNDMVDIVNGINATIKSKKINYIKFAIAIDIIKFKLMIHNYDYKSAPFSTTIKKLEADNKFYLDFCNRLKALMKDIYDNDFANLDVLYLLSIQVSTILEYMSEYMREITNMVYAVNDGIYYSSPSEIFMRDNTTQRKIDNAIKSLEK